MRAFVTGGTGFVGAHVVRKLLERGATVKALARPTSDLRNLDGLGLSLVRGDITEPSQWESELDGCDALFHVAADYRLWVPDPGRMFTVNVEGTRQVLQAAIRYRVPRIVHTSTVGALAYPRDASEMSDEESEPSDPDLVGPYKQSKRAGELIARELAAQGHPIIIVYPSTPVGPMDTKPTPTGKIILDCLRGKMPAYLDTGLNWIDVRDCAGGHLLAAERGVPGERYILGGQNLPLKSVLQMAARAGGVKAPRLRVPYAVAYAFALLDTFIADHITKRAPTASVVAVKLAGHHMYFSPAKAVRELGLPQSPIEDAIRDAVTWYRDNGYV